MSLFTRFAKRPSEAVIEESKPVERAPIPEENRIPDGMSIEDFRGEYRGVFVRANPDCGNCHGGGLVPAAVGGTNGKTSCICTQYDTEVLRTHGKSSSAAKVEA